MPTIPTLQRLRQALRSRSRRGPLNHTPQSTPHANQPAPQLPLKYCALVGLSSVPFWILGAQSSRSWWHRIVPINLPISALMACCPGGVAAVQVYRQAGRPGVQALLRRAVDVHKITDRRWYAPIMLLMPALMLAEYGIMRWRGLPLPQPELALRNLPLFFGLFLIAASGEEVGWQGYAFEPLQARWGALAAASALGLIWGLWHIVPYAQAQRSAWWIGWQCCTSIALRLLIVWIYNHTNQSVFAAALFHAQINTSVFLFPNLGSHYDPAIAALLTWAVASAVIWRAGLAPPTLADPAHG